MTNATSIARLNEIGPLPDDGSSAIGGYRLKEFDELLQKIAEPLSAAQALTLLNLGPPDTSTFAIEWALVHAVGTSATEALLAILPSALDNEVKRISKIRLANS